jgi:hypothetical protein
MIKAKPQPTLKTIERPTLTPDHQEWWYQQLWVEVIIRVINDLRFSSIEKRRASAQYFFVGERFAKLCELMSIDMDSVQKALLPADFIADNAWRLKNTAPEPIVKPLQLPTPAKAKPVPEELDNEFKDLGLNVDDPESFVLFDVGTHTFDSRKDTNNL